MRGGSAKTFAGQDIRRGGKTEGRKSDDSGVRGRDIKGESKHVT